MLHTGLIAPVSELLERHKRERPDKIAYWDSISSISYARLALRTAAIAVALAKNGLAEGDRVAIYLPNGVDWIEACFGGLRAGAVLVPISYDAAEAEIGYRLSDADCSMVITTPARGDLIKKLASGSDDKITLVFAGAGAEGADLWLGKLAAGNGEGARDPADIDQLVLYHLHVGHYRPRERRAAFNPRHVVDCCLMLGADPRLERRGCRAVAAPLVPFLCAQSFGAERARGWCQRAYHGAVLAAGRPGIIAEWQIHVVSWRADDVSLPLATGAGNRRQPARQHAAATPGQAHAAEVRHGSLSRRRHGPTSVRPYSARSPRQIDGA